jgi:hypothetical protein
LSLDEVDAIIVVLHHACSNCENIGVEDNILWWKIHLRADQDIIGAFAYTNFLFFCGSLTLFIKSHDDHSSPMLANDVGMTNEFILANLE